MRSRWYCHIADSSRMVLAWGDCSRHIFAHFSELNVTLPSFQSILGLCFFSHGSPMIIGEFPIVMQCSFISDHHRTFRREATQSGHHPRGMSSARRPPLFSATIVCSRRRLLATTNNTEQPRRPRRWTPRTSENLRSHKKTLLLANTTERRRTVHCKLSHLPKIEDLPALTLWRPESPTGT
jgi:hypothetical protein